MPKTKIVNLSEWYRNLTKKEKSIFLDHMYNKFHIRQDTLRRKLSNDKRYKISTLEYNVLINTIEKGDWNEEN